MFRNAVRPLRAVLPCELGCWTGVQVVPFRRGFAAQTADISPSHLEHLLDAIVKPSTDQQAALQQLFSDFDGEAIIQTSGVLSTLEPHAHKVLGDLAISFRESADSFSVKQCANILSTMVLLGHFDNDLKDAIVDRVLSLDLAAADPEALGSICYSLGVGGYFDRKFLKAMEKLVNEQADNFSSLAMSKCLWMFSRVGYDNEHTDRALGALVARILADRNAPAEDLAYGLWACADNEEYADQLAYRIMSNPPEQVMGLRATAVAKLAYGLAKQQVDDAPMYAAIAKRAIEIAHEFFPRDIAKLLSAFGSVGIVVPPMLAALEPCMLKHLQKYTYNELDMVVTAYNAFGIHNKTVVKLANRMSQVDDA